MHTAKYLSLLFFLIRKTIVKLWKAFNSKYVLAEKLTLMTEITKAETLFQALNFSFAVSSDEAHAVKALSTVYSGQYSPALWPSMLSWFHQVCVETDLLIDVVQVVTWGAVMFRCSLSCGSKPPLGFCYYCKRKTLVRVRLLSFWLLFLESWMPCLRWVITSKWQMFN